MDLPLKTGNVIRTLLNMEVQGFGTKDSGGIEEIGSRD
jgi:hypothetical protein